MWLAGDPSRNMEMDEFQAGAGEFHPVFLVGFLGIPGP